MTRTAEPAPPVRGEVAGGLTAPVAEGCGDDCAC
jgi:hypothetical protein